MDYQNNHFQNLPAHRVIIQTNGNMDLLDKPICPADQILEALERCLGRADRIGRVAFPTGKGFEFIPVKEIVYFQASGNYTTLFLHDGRKILASSSLKEMDALVAAYPFCRVHNGHMINLEHLVRYYRGDGGEVELSNGVKLAVSRGRREEFFRAAESKKW